ncbi:MAG TPA: DUF3299 domain-containing protein [Pirellulales bacterium]|nr:DUF3299 domain-containing protein [Pirellulales bacterium]
MTTAAASGKSGFFLLSAFCLLPAASCLFLLAGGCGERSLPAATTASAAPQAARSGVATESGTNKANVDSVSADAPATSAGTAAGSGTADSSIAAAISPAEAAARAANQPARDIGFDNIKFNMQKDEPFQRNMITPAIESYDNSKIRIRGYILPSFQQTGLSQFVLVRDNMQCCFGPGAALYDCIVVQMNDGHTADFTTRPVAVEGVFSIQEIASPEGKCLAIYHMQADKVQ